MDIKQIKMMIYDFKEKSCRNEFINVDLWIEGNNLLDLISDSRKKIIENASDENKAIKHIIRLDKLDRKIIKICTK